MGRTLPKEQSGCPSCLALLVALRRCWCVKGVCAMMPFVCKQDCLEHWNYRFLLYCLKMFQYMHLNFGVLTKVKRLNHFWNTHCYSHILLAHIFFLLYLSHTALGEDFAEAVWNASVMVSIILCYVLGTGYGGLSLAINIIHYVYICLYMENKYRACNNGENTLHRVQTVHLAAILHQPEQPKWKVGDHMEKMN